MSLKKEEMEWEFNKQTKELFYLWRNHKIKVKQIKIFANGPGDLCIVQLPNNQISLKNIEKAKKEKLSILSRSNYDLAEIELAEAIPEGGKFLIIDINPTVKPMFVAIAPYLASQKRGKDYEMYGGDDYGIKPNVKGKVSS